MDYFCIIIISLVIILLIILVSSTQPRDSFLDKFSNKITILTGFIIGIGIFINFNLLNINEKNVLEQKNYNLIYSNYYNFLQILYSHYEDCPNFINSLFFPWQQKILFDNKNSSNNQNDKWFSVYIISLNLFKIWNDFLLASKINEIDITSWLNSNLSYFNSQKLYKIWNVYKYNYNTNTQIFIDNIFNNVINKYIGSQQDVNYFVNKIISSKEFSIKK